MPDCAVRAGRVAVIRPESIDGWGKIGMVAMLIAVILTASCRQSSLLAQVTPSIRIGADSASAPLAGDLLSAYESQMASSLLTLDIGSRETLLQALASEEIDAAILFGPLDEQELFDTPLGYTLLYIVIPTDIQVRDITRSELRAIFAGRIVSWQELGGPDIPIQPITAAQGFSERPVFEKLVMGDEPITSAARIAASSEGIVALAGTTAGGIGYSIECNLPDNLTTPAIDGVLPTLKEARNRHYALTSAVVFVSIREPEESLRSFLDWILGDTGQQVVQRHMLSLSD
ncbi:MAG: substrate-binding domain-containing protein [Anaerolineae bacterium]|nr:substrate-binding domain-containing protein [Anaerolineae bacterium]